jgi:hypothetical protein
MNMVPSNFVRLFNALTCFRFLRMDNSLYVCLYFVCANTRLIRWTGGKADLNIQSESFQLVMSRLPH